MDMNFDRFGLTQGQVEFLYNLEYHKTLNDIRITKSLDKKNLKREWLTEWKEYMSMGFSSFLQIEGVELHWYTEEELIRKIEEDDPYKVWFRLVLLEAMFFEPYYPLGLEKDKKGNDAPSTKYKNIHNAFDKSGGDEYIELIFTEKSYYKIGYIKRLRKCHKRVMFEMSVCVGLNFKNIKDHLWIPAIIMIAATLTAGMFAGPIAVLLVGSLFPTLSGAALTSACLAYLGGGAIAVKGFGMVGGTVVIVVGGFGVGTGVGTGVGGAVGAVGLLGKKITFLQSAKLLVTVMEIFLNDERDTVFADRVCEQYEQETVDVEKCLPELKLQAEKANGKEKREFQLKIENTVGSIKVRKCAVKILKKFISSFKEGLS